MVTDMPNSDMISPPTPAARNFRPWSSSTLFHRLRNQPAASGLIVPQKIALTL
jgi:hypothetical protein